MLDPIAHARSGTRHDTAERDACELGAADKFLDQFLSRPVEPSGRRDIRLLENPARAGQPQMGMRVADVEEKNHFSRVTSPPMIRSRWPCSVRNSNAPSSSRDSARPRMTRSPTRMLT